MSFQHLLVSCIVWFIGCRSQTCSCSGDGPEFSVTYSRSTTKQLDEQFQDVFAGPMYCTNYFITDASSDPSCGNQNGLDYIIIPTTSDCLNTALWSIRDVSNQDYVTDFNPVVGASPDFYITPSDPTNPTQISGIKIPMTVGLNPMRHISLCTRQDTTAFDSNTDDPLRTIGYVLNDGTAMECANATMTDICSGIGIANNPVQVLVTTAPFNTDEPIATTNIPTVRIRTTAVPTDAPTRTPTTVRPTNPPTLRPILETTASPPEPIIVRVPQTTIARIDVTTTRNPISSTTNAPETTITTSTSTTTTTRAPVAGILGVPEADEIISFPDTTQQVKPNKQEENVVDDLVNEAREIGLRNSTLNGTETATTPPIVLISTLPPTTWNTEEPTETIGSTAAPVVVVQETTSYESAEEPNEFEDYVSGVSMVRSGLIAALITTFCGLWYFA
eukprot:18052_1